MADQTSERLNQLLRDKYGPIYPITMYNQIIMPDGVSRFDGGVIVDRTDSIIGDPAPLNADTLGGIPADGFALKSDIPTESEVSWGDIQNIPAVFTPDTHTHTSGEMSDASVEEWSFTLEDGTVVTKKVLICV